MVRFLKLVNDYLKVQFCAYRFIGINKTLRVYLYTQIVKIKCTQYLPYQNIKLQTSKPTA